MREFDKQMGEVIIYVLKYEMPLTAKFVVEHYMTTGRFTNALYCAVSEGKDFQFVEMKEG